MLSGGYYTKKFAVEVEVMLNLLIRHPENQDFYDFELVSNPSKGEEHGELTVAIQLIDPDPEKYLVQLQDNRKIIHCITSEGKRLDIQFGREADRSTERAMVYVEL